MENEANLIGAKLQNLLNIPPIQRNFDETQTRFDGEPHASNMTMSNLSAESVMNTPPERARGQWRDEELVLTNRAWEMSQVMHSTKEKPSRLEHQKAPERTKTFRPQGPPPSSAQSSRRGYVDRRNFPNPQEFPPRYGKSHSRSAAQLASMLNSEHCPKNLTSIRQRLVHLCMEEQKPVPPIFMDEEVARVFSCHCIEPLQKKSIKFPRARYFCEICNYHMDNVTNAVNHILNGRHITNEKIWILEKTLTKMPPSSRNHELSIHSLILDVMNKYGIDDTVEKPLREGIVKRVNAQLADFKIRVTLFGSSLSGFGLKTSDVNMNVDLTKCQDSFGGAGELGMPKEDQASFIATLGATLKSLPQIENLRFEFKYMQILFFDGISQKECIIHLNNSSGVLTAQLFAEYDKIDARVRPLVVAFRRWAQLTEIDVQDKGLLPSHAYTIMALKHLQDIGVIPILTKSHDTTVEKKDFYLAADIQQRWRTENSDNLGKLWLSLLRNYAIEFPFKEFVVSICSDVVSKKADRIWNRRLSIEDPVIPKSNLARSVCSNRICDYICERIKYAYHYFAVPRMVGGIPLYSEIVALERVNPERIYLFGKPKPVAVVAPVQTLQAGDQARQVVQQRQGKSIHADENSLPRIRMINIPDYQGDVRVHVIQEDLHLIHQVLVASEYCYEFLQKIFQAGETPPVICKGCGGEGHLKLDCPEEKLPRCSRLTMEPLTPFTDNVLTEVLLRVFYADCLTEDDIKLRQGIVADISQALLPCFPEAILNLFGSSYNGFGLKHSDVDVCLRFGNSQNLKTDLQSDKINLMLKTIVERLKESGTMSEILAIPSAKVPIVKFKHRASKLEGDISLANRLALRNTAMLKCYTDIDPRLKVMGCFMKTISKLCDISDASKGSLSSYGYILMLIHFCQQHQPPVLPVLQKLPLTKADLDNVDGIDASFFSDLSQLPRVWRGYCSNNESVGQLFLSFLNFYSTKFSFDTHVINIRQHEPLSRESKLWLSDTAIAIEDPFDHTHNLGAGLSRRMGVYIVKCIQRFRDFFSCSIDQMPKNTEFAMHYLDPRRLRLQFDPPVDRQCRICNRIGHIAKTCTFAPKNDDGTLLYVQEEDGDERGLLNKFEADSGSPSSYASRRVGDLATTSSSLWPSPPAAQQQASGLIGAPEWMTSGEEDSKNVAAIAQEELRKLQEGISATLALMNLRSSPISEMPTSSDNGLQFFGSRDDAQADDGPLRAMIEKNPGVVFQLSDNGPNQAYSEFPRRDGPFNMPDDPDVFQNEVMGRPRSRFESESDTEDGILAQMMQASAARFGRPVGEFAFERNPLMDALRPVGPPPGYPAAIPNFAPGFTPFPPPGYAHNPPPGYSHPPGYAPIEQAPMSQAYEHNSMMGQFQAGPPNPNTSSPYMQQPSGAPMPLVYAQNSMSGQFQHGPPITSAAFLQPPLSGGPMPSTQNSMMGNFQPGPPITSTGYLQQPPGGPMPMTQNSMMGHFQPAPPITSTGFLQQQPSGGPMPFSQNSMMGHFQPGPPITSTGFLQQQSGGPMPFPQNSTMSHYQPGTPVTSTGYVHQPPGGPMPMTQNSMMGHFQPGPPISSTGFLQQPSGGPMPMTQNSMMGHFQPGPQMTPTSYPSGAPMPMAFEHNTMLGHFQPKRSSSSEGFLQHPSGPGGDNLLEAPIRDGYGGMQNGPESLCNNPLFYPRFISAHDFAQLQQNLPPGIFTTQIQNHGRPEQQSPSPEQRSSPPFAGPGLQNERDFEISDQPGEFPVPVSGGQGEPHPHAPMFVMGPSGQMLNHNYGDMSSHPYHLSHIHHGPMVSAVPVGMPPHTSNIQAYPMQHPQVFTTAPFQVQQNLAAQQYHQHQMMLQRQQQDFNIYIQQQHQLQQAQFLHYQTQEPGPSVPVSGPVQVFPNSNFNPPENRQ